MFLSDLILIKRGVFFLAISLCSVGSTGVQLLKTADVRKANFGFIKPSKNFSVLEIRCLRRAAYCVYKFS